MPIRYTIDAASGVVWSIASGVLTDADLIEQKLALLADPGFRPGMCEVGDARRAERIQVTPAGIRQLAGIDREHRKALAGYRLALIVADNQAFGFGRMYEMLTSDNVEAVRVFRDEAEACAWLGIPARRDPAPHE